MALKSVFDYITTERENYKARGVPLTDNWEWNMFNHINRSFLYKNSKFNEGENDGNRPFKNIIKPILNVAYRSEGFDVKDIIPFVNDAMNYYKSFLVKKYHPIWARKNNIDTFIDEMVESYTDYGLALVKNVNKERPEVVPLQRLAFCDQTDILSGALCEKHPFTIDKLLEMSGRWDSDSITLAIAQKSSEKVVLAAGDQKAKTPSPYIEVYELHGVFPESWLSDSESDDYGDAYDSTKYVPQMHIVVFYKNDQDEECGISLFSGREHESIYKALKRDDIFGRACGSGGIEELFEPQMWTNYSEIQLKEMLDIATMMLFHTTDDTYAEKNNVNEMEKGEIITTDKNTEFNQVVINPFNKERFDKTVELWEQRARTLGSADEALLGETPASGTPFSLQALVVQEGRGIHDYRRGKVATFLGEIYRDWTLPYLVTEMDGGQKFLDELSLDELNEVADSVITNAVNNEIKHRMIDKGQMISPEGQQLLASQLREEFMRKGNKRFMETVKGELKGLPMDVEMNIAGKQKDLKGIADKLTNIFRAIITNPQILQAPGMGKLFNEIIESSGLSPVDFTSFTKVAAPAPTPALPANGGEAPSPVGDQGVAKPDVLQTTA